MNEITFSYIQNLSPPSKSVTNPRFGDHLVLRRTGSIAVAAAYRSHIMGIRIIFINPRQPAAAWCVSTRPAYFGITLSSSYLSASVLDFLTTFHSLTAFVKIYVNRRRSVSLPSYCRSGADRLYSGHTVSPKIKGFCYQEQCQLRHR